MGKKKKQEKQKKKIASEEKALLKARKKAEKAAKDAKAEKVANISKSEKVKKVVKTSRPEQDGKLLNLDKPEMAVKVRKKSEQQVPEKRDLTEQLQIPDNALVNLEEVSAEQKAVPQDRDCLSVKEAILVFRALGDESRMEILSLLEKQELCAMELLQRVSIVQSTLSHHMKVLTESGLVNCRRDNKRIYYSVSAERMEMAAKFLNAEWAIPHSNASVRCRRLRESDWG